MMPCEFTSVGAGLSSQPLCYLIRIDVAMSLAHYEIITQVPIVAAETIDIVERSPTSRTLGVLNCCFRRHGLSASDPKPRSFGPLLPYTV
jgi:hypothetical protein